MWKLQSSGLTVDTRVQVLQFDGNPESCAEKALLTVGSHRAAIGQLGTSPLRWAAAGQSSDTAGGWKQLTEAHSMCRLECHRSQAAAQGPACCLHRCLCHIQMCLQQQQAPGIFSRMAGSHIRDDCVMCRWVCYGSRAAAQVLRVASSNTCAISGRACMS